jgi:hypothetical protein
MSKHGYACHKLSKNDFHKIPLSTMKWLSQISTNDYARHKMSTHDYACHKMLTHNDANQYFQQMTVLIKCQHIVIKYACHKL